MANKRIKKTIPKYETKAWMGHVWLNSETGKKEVRPDHPMYMQYEIDKFAVGDEIWTKCTNKKRKRTDAQNDYMHLYFSLIAMSSGHTMLEIKNWVKGKFLTNGITEVFGDKVRVVKDTRDLKVLEMMELLEEVEAETGVPLPDAEPFNMPMTEDEWESLKDEQKRKYRAFKPKLKGINKLSTS